MIENYNSRKVFVVINTVLMVLVASVCFLPILHIFAMSLSSSWAATGGLVYLWPVAFSTASYSYVMQNQDFYSSFWIAIERVLIGVPYNMLLTILCAYPLSREKGVFKSRDVYSWFFVVTIMLNSGLIPWYMTIKNIGLIDTIWALILPIGLPVFNMLLLMNFFRQLPKEIEESAFLDGAGHWTTLIRLYVPMSAPAIATVTLFCIVTHWNSWFDGIILMNNPKNMPLQSYLQTVIVSGNIRGLSAKALQLYSKISNRTVKSAQIFVAMVPILAVYPFLQKYFMKGIIMGSVKG